MFSFAIICHNSSLKCNKCHNSSKCHNGYNGVIIHISVIIYSKCYNGHNSHVTSHKCNNGLFQAFVITSGTPISCIYMEYSWYIPCICRPHRYPWDIHVYSWIYHVYPTG